MTTHDMCQEEQREGRKLPDPGCEVCSSLLITLSSHITHRFSNLHTQPQSSSHQTHGDKVGVIVKDFYLHSTSCFVGKSYDYHGNLEQSRAALES